MSNYKLAAFDMDGTLLNSEKKVLDSSLQALKKASERRKILALSTGRNLVELKEYRKELPMIKYIMAISGSLIIDNITGETVFEHPLETDIVKKIFQISKGCNAMIHLHGKESHVQSDQLPMMAKCGMAPYFELFSRICTTHKDIYEDYVNNPFQVYKFNFYCVTEEERERLKRVLSELPLTMSYAETKSLECSPLGISKASGLRELCRILNISVSDTIAVGDADNDEEILKAAGLPIAMGNSNEKIKNICKAVVDDCDGDGIKQVIENYLL